MAQVTYYVALPFRHIDGEITAGEPQECRDAFKARSVAAILASDPNNCGAVAFADYERSRPLKRDDVAHRNEMMSPVITR